MKGQKKEEGMKMTKKTGGGGGKRTNNSIRRAHSVHSIHQLRGISSSCAFAKFLLDILWATTHFGNEGEESNFAVKVPRWMVPRRAIKKGNRKKDIKQRKWKEEEKELAGMAPAGRAFWRALS
jgi:hypothetical protein